MELCKEHGIEIDMMSAPGLQSSLETIEDEDLLR